MQMPFKVTNPPEKNTNDPGPSAVVSPPVFVDPKKNLDRFDNSGNWSPIIPNPASPDASKTPFKIKK